MRWKLGMAAGTLAIAVAALGAGAVLAGQSDDGPGQGSGSPEVLTVAAEPVAGPTADAPSTRPLAGRRAPAPPKKPRVLYLETAPQSLPPGKTGFVIGSCAGKARAINGYYFGQDQFNGFGLENEGDSPAGVRRWAFYLENETAAPVGGITFGLICLKNVK